MPEKKMYVGLTDNNGAHYFQPATLGEIKSALAKAEAPAEKRFPIQGGGWVPWAIAEEAYKTYAKHYGTSQSLARLAERGGFGAHEFAFLLAGDIDMRDHNKDKVVAKALGRLADYRS